MIWPATFVTHSLHMWLSSPVSISLAMSALLRQLQLRHQGPRHRTHRRGTRGTHGARTRRIDGEAANSMYFVEALESAESVGQIADSLTTDSAKWKWNARYAKTKHRVRGPLRWSLTLLGGAQGGKCYNRPSCGLRTIAHQHTRNVGLSRTWPKAFHGISCGTVCVLKTRSRQWKRLRLSRQVQLRSAPRKRTSPSCQPGISHASKDFRRLHPGSSVKSDEAWNGLKIRPHRRCWGVIFRMALVKGYRFTWGGCIFRPKPPVFDRSWRSPSKNTVKNSTEDTCSWTRPSKIGKRKVKKPRVFQLFDLNFLVCNIFFCGSAGGRARRRIFEFLDPFSDWFSSFCDSRNTGFYSVFLFSACLTASFKTSKNLVNYAVLCYGVNENIVNTSVFWRWLKNTVNYSVFGHLTLKNHGICSGFCFSPR